MNSTSSIARYSSDFFTRSTTTIIVETSIMIFLGIISICGNLLVITTVCYTKSLRNVTNYFVVSLAFTNLLMPTLALPLTLGWSVKGAEFKVDSRACDFQSIMIVSLVFLTVINIALMAVNRYVRVCRSQKYPRIFSKKNAVTMIIAAWTLTFLLSTTVLKASGLTYSRFVPNLMICLFVAEKGSYQLILGNMCFIICVGVPLTIMFVCYYKVFQKIREHKRSVGPASTAGTRRAGLGSTVREIKVTWTLFTVLLSYLLLWIPALFIQLMSNFIVRIPRSVHMVVVYIVALCGCVNPLIYGVMNNAFRSEYAKIFKLKCRSRKV